MARSVLSLVALVTCAQPGQAVPVAWLYDVDVAVDGRTAAARMAVSGAALAEVLSRVTGLAHVPRNARVREALADPEAFYNRFVFLNDSELRIQFVPAAILKLVDEARLPVWSANRPQVIVWLAVESDGVRQIVDGNHVLAAPLARRARQRGLIVKLPLMDLEDRLQVQPSIIRGRLFSTIERASRRYGADVILIGRLQERACPGDPPPDAELAVEQDPDPGGHEGQEPAFSDVAFPAPDAPEVPGPAAVAGPNSAPDPDSLPDADPMPDAPALFETPPAVELAPEAIMATCGPGVPSRYVGSVEAWMDGEEFATDFALRDLLDAGRVITDFFANELAGRLAVLARETNRIAVTIGGIKSPIGYGQLLDYLDGLEFITGVDVAAVQDDRLQVVLHTRAAFEQMVELLHNDGRIRRDPTHEASLTWQGP